MSTMPTRPKRTLTAQLNALRTTATALLALFMILLVIFVVLVIAIKNTGANSKETTTTSSSGDASQQQTSDIVPDDSSGDSETEAQVVPPTNQTFAEDAKLIALTFDDGPDSTLTPQVLDALERNGVVATFFVLGQNVSGADPALLQRMLDLGCEIGNHTWSHSVLSQVSADTAYEELQKCDQALMDKIGQKATVIRPPQGAGLFNDGLFQYSYDNQEYVVNWNDISCPADWQAPALGDAHYTAQHVIDNACMSDMVLLHDSHQSTVDSLDEMIQGLKEKGYIFVTVSQLLEARAASFGLTMELATSKSWNSATLAEAYPGGPIYGIRYAYSGGKMVFEDRKQS